MHSKQIHAGRHSIVTGEHHLLLLIPEHAVLLKDRTQIMRRTDHVVIVGIRHVVEGDINTSGNMAARDVWNGHGTSAVETAVTTRVNAGSVQLALVEIDHSLFHLFGGGDQRIVHIEVKGSIASHNRIATLQIVLLRLPTNNAAIHDVHVDILVEHTEHEPSSGSTVNALAVVEDNFVMIANAHTLNGIAENFGAGKLLDFTRSSLANGLQVEELSSGNVLLGIRCPIKMNHTAINSDMEFLLGEMWRVVSMILTCPILLYTHSVETRAIKIRKRG